MNTNDQTYKRSQVEWALWQLFPASRPHAKRPPQAFLTRIKRLWEIDRQTGPAGPGYAFFDHAPEGRGNEVSFSAFNAFCLAIGLDLLDAGYKQAEVVTLLQHIRSQLEVHFREIAASPPAPPDLIAAKDRPGCPTYVLDGFDIADCRHFMILRKVELTEVHRHGSPKAKGQAMQAAPVFCDGIDELRDALHRMGESFRKAMVLEIAEMAVVLFRHLEKAPLLRRGRS